MRIRLSDLRRLIDEALFLEYKVGSDVTLYHRTDSEHKVGDVLSAPKEKSTGRHWLASRKEEWDLERYRIENHPDLPSRLDCIYATFNPRSRFLGKGKLYAVRPIGRTHVTDSMIIDRIASSIEMRHGFYDEIIEYWNGVDPHKSNLNDLEVLMDKALVVDVVDEGTRVMRGTKFVFGPNAPKIKAHINIDGFDPTHPTVPASDGATDVPVDDAFRILNAPGVFALPRPRMYRYGGEIRIVLGPGFEGFVVTYRSSNPGSRVSKMDISVSPGDAPGKHGVMIHVEEPYKFVKAFRDGDIERR